MTKVKTVCVYFNKPVSCPRDMDYLWITNVLSHHPERTGDFIVIVGNGWDSETTSKYQIKVDDVAYIEEYVIDYGSQNEK